MEHRHRPSFWECWSEEKHCAICGVRITPVKNARARRAKHLPRLSIFVWYWIAYALAGLEGMKNGFPDTERFERMIAIYMSSMPFFGPFGMGKRVLTTFFMDYEKETLRSALRPLCMHRPAFQVRVRGLDDARQDYCKYCGAPIEPEDTSIYAVLMMVTVMGMVCLIMALMKMDTALMGAWLFPFAGSYGSIMVTVLDVTLVALYAGTMALLAREHIRYVDQRQIPHGFERF